MSDSRPCKIHITIFWNADLNVEGVNEDDVVEMRATLEAEAGTVWREGMAKEGGRGPGGAGQGGRGGPARLLPRQPRQLLVVMAPSHLNHSNLLSTENLNNTNRMGLESSSVFVFYAKIRRDWEMIAMGWKERLIGKSYLLSLDFLYLSIGYWYVLWKKS